MEQSKVCEYNDCYEDATVDDEVGGHSTWLCERHSHCWTNSSGYCNRNCQLGYGCDGSC